MAKKKKKRSRRSNDEDTFLGLDINPETKRGIFVVILFALAALIFLSFFQIAGSLGDFINLVLGTFFGIDRYLVPIVLIIVGATLAYPERGTLSTWNYVGLFFFFLSFNALINMFLVNRPEPFTQDLTIAGGWLGQFLGTLLPSFLGYWGAIVCGGALLLVSIMLLFNTSLRNVVSVHRHLTGWFGKRAHYGAEEEEDWEEEEEEDEMEEEEIEADEEDEIEEEEEEDEMFEEMDDEETDKAFRKTPVETQQQTEAALTTTQSRRVPIPMKLLERSNSKASAGDIERNKSVIEQTFDEFGIDVEMGKTSVGPTVTQYTLRPSQGVKLSRIVSLQNDLALALAAHPIRMEAPIPGRSLVGIEVPNTKVATVTLRDVMETKNYKKRPTALSVPLGKDVSGSSHVIALEKMPHLLVAGATGSGKSVCLNTLILSWLYQNGPDDLKLILVDPKRVELTIYNGIPHLLVPPITSVDDTVNALKWTVREMERRLDILSHFGARNITDYNERAEERMPKIVVVIDELADLMSSNGREVEASVVRIAQMARAVGIHLVLATQRPSVDVITGLIKANIPGRIAFAVASQTDSRTILDMSGAEKLLGRGDMLFTSAELSKPKRIQGAFVSTEEIEDIVKFLRRKGGPDYNMAVTEITKTGTVFDEAGDDHDALFEEAIDVVLQAGKASTSYLQRRLRVGYARAARIMDELEEAGVIGPGSGAKPREILIDSWPPGGDITEGMPTAQDDYDEGYGGEDRFADEEDPVEEEEEWEEEAEEEVDDEDVVEVEDEEIEEEETEEEWEDGEEIVEEEFEEEEEEGEEEETDWEEEVDDGWVDDEEEEK